MKIQGLEGKSASEIQLELQRGAKFVVYSYCVSLILITFRRPSEIYFLPPRSPRFVVDNFNADETRTST